VCGLDPTAGLVASLGFSCCVLCVVGVAREPSLGEDAAGSRTAGPDTCPHFSST